MIDLLGAKRALTPMGNRKYDRGGGGSSTTYTQNVPKEAMPYYMGLVERAWNESNVPYQTYQGERLAGFTPMQNQAFWQASNQQLPGQVGLGSQAAAGAMQQTPQQTQGYNAMNYALGQGGGTGFTQGTQAIQAGIAGSGQTGPTAATNTAMQQFQNLGQQSLQTQSPQADAMREQLGGLTQQALQTDPTAATTGAMEQFQDLGQRSVQAGEQAGISTQRFTAPGIAESYMDPYVRNVIDIQKREAGRDFDQQSQNVRAQTGMRAGVGGIGGYRDQILQAEMNRNQAQRLDDIEAKGLQDAYARGAQQFNADEQRLLAAAGQRGQLQLQGLAQAGDMTGRLLGAEQFNRQMRQQGVSQAGQLAGQYLDSSLAERQLRQQGIGQAGQLMGQYLSADQFNRQLGLQGASQMGQLGQSLAGLGLDQSRFYGQLGGQLADAGRADRGVSLDAARTLGGLGGQQFEMEQGLTDRLNRYGQMQQQQRQQFLDQQYNDFLTQRAAGREDLQFLSAILRGQNLGGSQIRQDPRPSGVSQLVGAGLSGLAMYNMMNQ